MAEMKYPSAYDGYLTPDCAHCIAWSNGDDGRGLGCNTTVPIDWCVPFRQMQERMEEQARQMRREEVQNERR